MPAVLYDASVAVFQRYLVQLGGLLDAAERFAQARGRPLDDLLAARLAPDMLPLETQIVIAANFTLRAAFPLAGEPVPPFGEFAPGTAGLRAWLERCLALLRSLPPQRFADTESRVLESQAGDAQVRLPARQFLFQYALPNFFFHLGIAYAILRSQGVPLGKAQFDGFHAYPAPP